MAPANAASPVWDPFAESHGACVQTFKLMAIDVDVVCFAVSRAQCMDMENPIPVSFARPAPFRLSFVLVHSFFFFFLNIYCSVAANRALNIGPIRPLPFHFLFTNRVSRIGFCAFLLPPHS